MTSALETTCCIVGGGPAGMMLGVLLSRAGVRTIVLEKHGDGGDGPVGGGRPRLWGAGQFSSAT